MVDIWLQTQVVVYVTMTAVMDRNDDVLTSEQFKDYLDVREASCITCYVLDEIVAFRLVGMTFLPELFCQTGDARPTAPNQRDTEGHTECLYSALDRLTRSYSGTVWAVVEAASNVVAWDTFPRKSA